MSISDLSSLDGDLFLGLCFSLVFWSILVQQGVSSCLPTCSGWCDLQHLSRGIALGAGGGEERSSSGWGLWDLNGGNGIILQMGTLPVLRSAGFQWKHQECALEKWQSL